MIHRIRKIIGLMRQVSLEQLVRNPRMELGRIMGWFARRIGRAADVAAHGAPPMPEWLAQEMVALAHIEPELLSAHGDVRQYSHYGVPVIPRPGELYRKLLEELGSFDYTHVMTLPWLVPGGADRGALYHLELWANLVPASSILVLTTENSDSPWADRLPAGVKLVQFGRIVGEMSFEAQVALMTRLLVQLQPDVLHNINSRVMWEATKVSGLAIRQRTTIFASLFCDDYDMNMVPVGYARSYLRECYRNLAGVLCDNSVYPRKWSRELGVPIEMFVVVPFPYDRAFEERSASQSNGMRRRVLWAGRFDRQKRPDILAAVAAAMPEIEFDVHGAAIISGGDPAMTELAKMSNVHVNGRFARLEDIVSDSHFAYLHTAAWEGVPTILFDVAAVGLPIVAPDVGGIRDFVSLERLVPVSTDVQGYVDRLRMLHSSDQLWRQVRAEQYDSLREGRSWTAFAERASAVPGLVPPPSPGQP